MTVTASELYTKYIDWFREKRNTAQAKLEILFCFSTEPEEGREWTEQDIYEQCRKIIRYWDNQPNSQTEKLDAVPSRVWVSVFTQTLNPPRLSHKLSPALRAAVGG